MTTAFFFFPWCYKEVHSAEAHILRELNFWIQHLSVTIDKNIHGKWQPL